MSQHAGPHWNVVHDDQRCEALVRGIPHYHWEWQRSDHRCPRRANQGRAGRMVCHIHGRARQVSFIDGGSNVTKKTDDKVQVGTVDLTPLWSELLPMMLEIYHTGNDGQRDTLRAEFQKMARAADAYNVMARANRAAAKLEAPGHAS